MTYLRSGERPGTGARAGALPPARDSARQGSFLDGILDGVHHACMTRITGKFQITLPKRLVDSYGIRVGDEVEIVAAGESIAIIPARTLAPVLSAQERLRHFDQATRRQEARQRGEQRRGAAAERGWDREELYTRGRSR